jgi:hypothetical protein
MIIPPVRASDANLPVPLSLRNIRRQHRSSQPLLSSIGHEVTSTFFDGLSVNSVLSFEEVQADDVANATMRRR